MRLRAFGGSRYGERVRIGEWPELDEAFLEDESALQTGLRAHGVGVLRPAPFLILRERQTVGDRSYAFTLLLDPGRDVWERFGWNGARILRTLLDDAELASTLLATPESAGDGSLALRIASLAPAADRPPGDGPPSPFELALVAAPLADSELLVSARQLGLDRRPDLEETSTALDRLPICFRAGLGFLVGGRPGSGWTFGCSLIVDDVEQAGPPPDPRRALETAASVLDGCRALSRRPRLAPTVSPFLDAPLAEWSAPPEVVLRQIAVLARSVDESRTAAARSVDAELVGMASEAASTDGPFSSEIRAAFGRLAKSVPGPLPALLTRFLIDGEIDSPGSLEPAVARALDPTAVADALLLRQLDLLEDRSRFPDLSPEQAIAVWRAQIRATAEPEAPGRLFARALVSLSTRVASRSALAEVGRGLGQIAVERAASLGTPLTRWLSLRHDADLWPLLADELRTESRRAFHASRDGHLAYLAFADDPRGDWLAATHAADVATVVETALQEIRAAGPLREEASRWLSECARSPVRPLLTVEKKKRIADVVEGRWTRFRALWTLCHGEAPPRLPGGSVAAAETELLLKELPQVLAAAAEAPVGVKLADLDIAALGRIVGGKLTRKLLEQAARGEPREKSRLARGLREQGASDLYQEVIRDAWLEPGAEEGLSPEDLDEGAREGIVASLLFGPRESDDGYRARLALLLARQDDAGLEIAVKAAVSSALASPEGRPFATFFRRFGAAPELVEGVLSRLDAAERRRMVERGAADAPADLDALAATLLARALGRRATLEPFPAAGRAVFEHLLEEAEKGDTLRRVARRVLGSEAAGAVDRLRALLAGAPSSAAAGDPASSDADTPRRRALLEGTRTSLRDLASRWKAR